MKLTRLTAAFGKQLSDTFHIDLTGLLRNWKQAPCSYHIQIPISQLQITQIIHTYKV